MSASIFIQRQITQIRVGRCPVVSRKLMKALRILPLWPLVVPAVMVIRLIRPWFLIRLGSLDSSRIGHLAAVTEMYVCERAAGINKPNQRYVDLFYVSEPICNQQLVVMWNRVLHIWPAWILAPIDQVNRLIPGGTINEISLINTQYDRDVHNLRDRFPPFVEFTAAERERGEAGLREMGIPSGASFVCLSVRDSAYLDAHIPTIAWSYHNYRNCDIQKYVLAAEELANRGYFVIRMGVKVREGIKSNHSRVIDYACNGMRTDFMDIYLCAKCEFMISTGEGLVCVAELFRRPIVVVSLVPLGYFNTYYSNLIGITRHHYLLGKSQELTLREIFTCGVGFCGRSSDYETQGVEVVENTPEEIRALVIEMLERLKGTWQPWPDDDALQRRFWEIYPVDARDAYHNRLLHGKVRARYGSQFLRDNREWLE